MEKKIFFLFATVILLALFILLSECEEKSSADFTLHVNLQVDAELEDVWGIRNIVVELLSRDIKTTIFVTADYANRNAIMINEFYSEGFEIALHGYYTGEQLATMTYDEQRDLLERAKKAVEGCQPCGTYKPVVGFRPQYFSQDENTYTLLDELGIRYNCGFKAGELFTPGHELDAVPYLVEGHRFYAVPLTTLEYEVKSIYLCDISCALNSDLLFSPAQWSGALQAGIESALEKKVPLVVLIHGWYTGEREKYSYWDPFIEFLDSLEGKATFVQTQKLVEMYSIQ